MIQVRKVIEHVYEKVMGQGSDAGSQTANNSTQDKGEESEDLAAIAEEKVELLCNEQVRSLYPLYEVYLYPGYEEYRGYIVFPFSVMFVCKLFSVKDFSATT